MCGRYTLATSPDGLAAAFDLPAPPTTLPPRYNVAPSQLVAVIALKADGTTRGLARLKWGFVPNWANDPTSGPRPINARAETVATKPPFDDSFRERRCLIPADGFFEWLAEDGKKVAHHFRLRGGGPFAFAGIWDCWRAEGSAPVLTCAIITVPANDVVKPFHDRMPAILSPDHYDGWLDHDTPIPDVRAMLAPYPVELMEVVRVGPAVNSPKNDGPECLAPAA